MSRSSIVVLVEAKHLGLAAMPINQIGNLLVPDVLQQKSAVIFALHALPPVICAVASV
jgi:hypothetical protein